MKVKDELARYVTSLSQSEMTAFLVGFGFGNDRISTDALLRLIRGGGYLGDRHPRP